jgi:cellulose synthase/poly-beta-1,6-N-acetylglucosamine synthase-like glycosyltransferase
MIYAFGLIISFYALACFWLCWQWIRIPNRTKFSLPIPTDFKASVIIPVRNEAANIGVLLDDLQKQSLAKKYFEVIIVDDSSTDNTAEIVTQFKVFNNLDLKLISLADVPVSAPKKRAITEALKTASGQLIVTTDGDCRVGERWLETIAQTYLQTGAKFISGPVTFLNNPTPTLPTEGGGRIFQTIEFSSLIGAGACLLEAGHPTMCNGANLAYERTAFEEVGGYAGVDHIASGDDEFLLQKIHLRYRNHICFLKNKYAIVHTQPQENWRAFYRQRVRWASKWAVNRRMATMGVAVFIFLVNLITLIVLVAAITDNSMNIGFNTILLIKYLPEFLFLSLIIRFLDKKRLLLYIPLVQLFYPFYVLLFGLIAQRKGYEWKGRRLR